MLMISVDYKADHDLFRDESVPDQHMAHQAFMLCLVISADLILFHKCKDLLQDYFVYFHAQRAIGIWNDTMGPSGVESGYDVSFIVRSDWKLRLVPVVKWVVHAYDRLQRLIQHFRWNLPDTHKISSDLVFFEGQLAVILHLLDLATAAFAGHRAFRLFYPVWRWRKNIHQPCIAVVLLGLHHFGLHHVADDGVFNEQRVSIHLSDAFSVNSYIFDRNRNQFIFLHKHTPFRQLGTGLLAIGDVTLLKNVTSLFIYSSSSGLTRTGGCSPASHWCSGKVDSSLVFPISWQIADAYSRSLLRIG